MQKDDTEFAKPTGSLEDQAKENVHKDEQIQNESGGSRSRSESPNVKSRIKLDADEERRRYEAREEKKRLAELEKKNKRKQKKEEKEVKKPGSNNNKTPVSKVSKSSEVENHKIASGNTNSQNIQEEMGDKPDVLDGRNDGDEENKRVTIHEERQNAVLFKVDKDVIVVTNSEMERLEEIRRERERNAREREAERQKQEELKKKTQAEYDKLQENLALKNEMKNKKHKKR